MKREYDNTNSGMLARNQRKEKPTHPEYTGSINADGVEYWMSAWVKEGGPGSKLEGQKYFSIAITRKDAPPSESASKPDLSAKFDDLPF